MQEDQFKRKLEMLEREFADCYGLYNGKTGLAISWFLMGSLTDNQYYSDKGQFLLDELGDNILKVKGTSFHEGLAGVGWGIEWLVQNNFISANTDDILSDLDDELYKTVVYEKSPNISLYDGTIGKAMYFYKRWFAKNPDTPRSRIICNEECLILLTDEISEALDKSYNDDHLKLEESRGDYLISICQALIFLCKLRDCKINLEVAAKSICQGIAVLEAEFENYESADIPNPEYIIYLIYAYLNVGLKLKDRAIERRAKKLLLCHQSRDKPYLLKPHHVYVENKLLHSVSKGYDGNYQQMIGHGNFKMLCEITMSSKFQMKSWDEAWIL
ncbi:hypothetical protein [Mucilaginibacter sp. SJ]|uniref:hypothetical protein n=1 Tax=Mucilaginibacter sp. SJ TaxID=3029053 RepID=UPI0023A93688|nr:hypothetical protein [Mucilaginibacter sp. SJ]WEA01827.1 hypothetical protein MusilaSJ_02675 [Mucilaginibacter sp. SJ]